MFGVSDAEKYSGSNLQAMLAQRYQQARALNENLVRDFASALTAEHPQFYGSYVDDSGKPIDLRLISADEEVGSKFLREHLKALEAEKKQPKKKPALNAPHR